MMSRVFGRHGVVVAALVVVSASAQTLTAPVGPTSSLNSSAASLPPGFIWLVDGCSISLAVLDLTAQIFAHFTPADVHSLECGEMWHHASEVFRTDRAAASAAPGERFSLVDMLTSHPSSDAEAAAFAATLPSKLHCREVGRAAAGEQNPTARRFLVAKLTTNNYANSELRGRMTDLDTAPPPFILSSMVRSNLVEYVACLLRDRSTHCLDAPQSPVRHLDDIGYVVYASTGERVTAAKSGGFRAGKDDYRAVLDTRRLPDLLAEIRAFEQVSKANMLHDMKVATNIYVSDDLIDLLSEGRINAAAEIWLSLLARAGIATTKADVVDYLRGYAQAGQMDKREGFNSTAACDLREKIYNLDEVRVALRGTAWERYAYCPSEWVARAGPDAWKSTGWQP